MSTVQFYIRSLLLPPIVLGLLLLLPDTNDLVTLRAVGFWGLLCGGIPYGFLVWWLVRFSKAHPLPSLERVLRWSPVLFLPLVASWTFLLVILVGTLDAGSIWIRVLSTSHAVVLVACGYAVFIGYISVGCVFLLRRALQHYRVVERAQP